MTPPPGTSSIDALVQTVGRLWPEAEDVRLVRSGGADAPAGVDTWELVAAPDATRVRLLVPSTRRGAAGALARYSAALSPREVVQRIAVGGVTRVAGPVIMRDRVRVQRPGEDHIVAVVEEIVGRPVVLSLGIGNARANRKPVLGAFDDRGRPVAFVKVGDTEVSSAHVLAEADALRELAGPSWKVLEVPRLLGQRRWRDMDVVVMSALLPPAWQGRDARWPIPDAAVAELEGAFAGGRLELRATPWWQRVATAAALLADEERRVRLLDAIAAIDATVGSAEVAVGAWHGDFTPWNVARHRTRLLVWDWERFETGVPCGLDRLHYAVNTLARERGFGVATVLEGLRRGSTGERDTEPAVAASYLLALAIRYLQGAEQEGGEVIDARALQVLELLSEFTRHLGSTTKEPTQR